MNEVSLKPVIEELENLFSKFNARFFDGGLEKPVITVSPEALEFVQSLGKQGFTLVRPRPLGLKGSSKGGSSSRKYVCPCCGAIIRATKEVHVICADCDCEFQEEI